MIFLAVICLVCVALSSCSNDGSLDSSVNPSNEQLMAPVTVVASGFEISQQDFSGTRAVPVSDYAEVKFVTLAFFKTNDGTPVYKYTQDRSDNTTYTTFGEFSTSLPLGSYTMVVVANAGANPVTLSSATSATYGENRVLDTFVVTKAVNITSTSAVNLSETLTRIVSAVVVKSTDNRPSGVTHIRLTYSGGSKSFNPTTGLSNSNTGFVNLMDLSAAAGSPTTVGGYLFLASDEQTMDVTIETLDSEGVVLFSKTITNVPLKRNRQTILSGSIYDMTAAATSGSFQVSTIWFGDYNMDF